METVSNSVVTGRGIFIYSLFVALCNGWNIAENEVEFSIVNSWGMCPDANMFYGMPGAILFIDSAYCIL